nr:hypothetical protein [Pseudenhygromyxa sp. WMMC2535]
MEAPGGLDATLALLDDMPGLVGQAALLTGPDVDVSALGEGVGAQLCGAGRVVADADVFHGHPREGLDAGAEGAGQATRTRQGAGAGLGAGAVGEGLAALDGRGDAWTRGGQGLEGGEGGDARAAVDHGDLGRDALVDRVALEDGLGLGGGSRGRKWATNGDRGRASIHHRRV